MNDAQYANCVADKLVRRNIGCACDHEFPRALYPAQTTTVWEIDKPPCGFLYAFIDVRRRLRIVLGDPHENSEAIVSRVLRPNKPHAGLAPLRAFARS